MPELPEVETIRRVLAPRLQGIRIEKAAVYRPETIAHPDAGIFCKQVAGQSVVSIGRRGKYLFFDLSGGRIVVHLRMTGCLLLTPACDPKEKHTHLVFLLENGEELRYADPRRFGRFWFLQNGEKDTFTGLDRLGKEPFDTDFSAAYLRSCLGKRKKAIKECLMEQKIIAGIGNIYSDEILFTARIHPLRPAGSLTEAEWERLAAVIPQQLTYFIEKNEISFDEYRKTKGKEYRNTPFLRVYGHEGKACPICGRPLHRTVTGGRSSIYCPECQRDT